MKRGLSFLNQSFFLSIMLIDDTYNASFWIGIGVSLITNLIQAFAMAFQRKSHILNDHLYPRELRKPAYRRPLWLTSFIAYLGANITGTVFSVGYLPVVILAPIGAINLVFNAIAARVVLGDPFTVRSVGGIYKNDDDDDPNKQYHSLTSAAFV